MVTLTLYGLLNYAQQSFNSSPTLADLTRKIHAAWRQKPAENATAQHSFEVLYPRRLKQSKDVAVHASATAEFFSPASPSRTTNPLDIPVTAHYRPPREPIVLCHGLYGFDIWGPDSIPALQFRYWNGVEDALAKLGAKVIVTGVPKTGSIWDRSQELHTILKAIMDGKRVNFVAHSMGGLDCRHLISHIKDRPYHVQSLTTICTPHRGSPVMDWFRDHIGVGGARVTNTSTWTPQASMSAVKGCMRNDEGTIMPLSLQQPRAGMAYHIEPALQKLVQWFDEPAYANLTTDYCQKHFNPSTPDDPSVAYYSYGASAKIPAWSSVLGIPWKFMQQLEGENDGIVSIESAKWGKYVKTIHADHWDLSGKSCVPYRWRTDNTSDRFDRVDFYIEMANNLYQQGH